MNISTVRLGRFGAWLIAGSLASLGLSACLEEQSGILIPSGPGNAGTKATGGSKATAGAGAVLEGGMAGMGDPGPSEAGDGTAPIAGSVATGGTGGSGGTEAVAGTSNWGGAPSDAAGASSGGASDHEQPGVHIGPACVFHSAPVAPELGEGGGGPTGPTVTLQTSPFVGGYLADAAGRTLYTYGADRAGDCSTPPVSNCTADCLVSWPVFDAGGRELPPELSDAGFGTIARAEGGYQTTYMGWPLYYYKTDLTLGQMAGQGKGKIWFVAEVSPPSIVIMKAGANKYLADAAGRTLYVSAADQVGTSEVDPVSNCSGECLQTFEGFNDKKLSPVSVLEPLDFSVFVQSAGKLQLAYKGMPLYRAATDLKSGDMTGTLVAGFTAAVP